VSTRVVFLHEDDERRLDDAACFLRTLAAIEHSHMLGDDEAVTIILGALDPVEVKLTGAALMDLGSRYAVAPARIDGEPRAVTHDGRTLSGTSSVSASAASSARPSPSFFPDSRKAPCA